MDERKGVLDRKKTKKAVSVSIEKKVNERLDANEKENEQQLATEDSIKIDVMPLIAPVDSLSNQLSMN